MDRPAAALASLAALLAAAPARGGELRGVVRFEGTPPPAALRPVHRDRAACGEEAPDESLLVQEGRLANAVIQVRGTGLAPAPARGRLHQARCRFAPRVQVLPPGSTLQLTSADPVLHGVHGWLGRSTAFQATLAGPAEQAERVLARPGAVRIGCDVHDWMAAWVVVAEGPAAVSGADGSWAIAGLPPGRYTVVAWHERLGERTAEVSVPAAGAATLDLSFGKGP